MRTRFFAALLLAAVAPLATHSAPNARPSLAEPSLAPDRAEIVFVSGGDIWTAALAGGEARLLVSHPATESRPLYSPDGSRLAFMSNRTGANEIYVLDLATGDTRRLTYDNWPNQLDSWSRDGRWVYFSSSARDISGMRDVHRISSEGGTPMQMAADRFRNEYWSAPAPSGDALAITATGMTSDQWWRHGHSHIDESQIWLVHTGAGKPSYEPVATDEAKNEWPMWSSDGKRLYYVSDRGGQENIWVRDAAGKGTGRQLSKLEGGRVLWPSISPDGKTIVFERDFGIWRMDTATGKTSPVEIALRGAPAGPDVTRLASTNQFGDLALSPDGKKVSFVSHGDVFAASAKDGGTAARLSSTPAAESLPVWSSDSRRVVYVSDRDGPYHLYLYDFGTGAETRITSDSAGDTSPDSSPDGKLISFVRGGKELMVLRPCHQAGAVARKRLVRAPAATPPHRVVRRQPVDRLRQHRQSRIPEHLCRPGRRRCGARHQFHPERVRRIHPVEPRRHLSPLPNRAADRAGLHRSRGSGSEDAEVSRGPVPRAVQGRAAEDAESAEHARDHASRGAVHAARAGTGQARPGAQDSREGKHRIRRHSPPCAACQRRPRPRPDADQPGRENAPVRRDHGRPAEPLYVLAGRTREGSRRSPAS